MALAFYPDTLRSVAVSTTKGDGHSAEARRRDARRRLSNNVVTLGAQPGARLAN